MWKNKHVIVAMLVAPILALMAWFAIDYFIAERPHAAKPGADYTLVARSNCRRASGSCDLFNGDFKLTISASPAESAALTLVLASHFPLVAATIGMAPGPGKESLPVMLSPVGADGKTWSVQISRPAAAEAAMQIVVVAGQSRYFAEVPAVFLVAEAPASTR
jgi:hypothetical protein